MNFKLFIQTWKTTNLTWAILEPFVIKLIEKNVPNKVTTLYENLAKYTQPAIDSLERLKLKVRKSPNALDDYCFNQGVTALENFAKYLLSIVVALRS